MLGNFVLRYGSVIVANAMALGADYGFESQNVLKVLSKYVNMTLISSCFGPRLLSMTRSQLDDNLRKVHNLFTMNP